MKSQFVISSETSTARCLVENPSFLFFSYHCNKGKSAVVFVLFNLEWNKYIHDECGLATATKCYPNISFIMGFLV